MGGGIELPAWPGAQGDLPGLSQRYVGGHAEDCECAHGNLQAGAVLAEWRLLLK